MWSAGTAETPVAAGDLVAAVSGDLECSDPERANKKLMDEKYGSACCGSNHALNALDNEPRSRKCSHVCQNVEE